MAAGALPTEGRRPFFRPRDWCSFGLTSGLTLTIYLVTLAPEVATGLEGGFVTGAFYAGVPAPPGFPLWTLYAHAFCRLPLFNPAWRVAVSSALAGSFACGLVALMVCRSGSEMLRAASPSKDAGLSPDDGRKLVVVSGVAAGAGLGFDGSIWPSAVVPGPWTLTVLLLAAVLCLLMRWVYEPDRRRYLYGAALVYGLGLSNSQLLFAAALGLEILVMLGDRRLARQICLVNTFLFGAGLWAWHRGDWPIMEAYAREWNVLCLLYFAVGTASALTCGVMIIRSGRLFCECRAASNCGFLVLLGLSIHLYSPVASMTNPPVNWAYPRTAEGFIHLVTRGQYEGISPTASWGRYFGQLGMYVGLTWKDLGALYDLAAILALSLIPTLRSRERRWMLGLLAVYLCLVLVVLVVLNPSFAGNSRAACRVFFSLSHVVLAVWAGYGLVLLGARVSGGGWAHVEPHGGSRAAA